MIIYAFVNILFILCSASSNQCQPNFANVQNTKKIVSNGCSVPSLISLPPDSPDFTQCCHYHDACYAICNENQAYCDNDFLACMKDLCKKAYKSAASCFETASMFHMGVSMFGNTGFAESQKDYCVCKPKTSLVQHYSELLEQFYGSYVDRVTVESPMDGDAGTTLPSAIPESIRKNITHYAEANGQKTLGRFIRREFRPVMTTKK